MNKSERVCSMWLHWRMYFPGLGQWAPYTPSMRAPQNWIVKLTLNCKPIKQHQIKALDFIVIERDKVSSKQTCCKHSQRKSTSNLGCTTSSLRNTSASLAASWRAPDGYVASGVSFGKYTGSVNYVFLPCICLVVFHHFVILSINTIYNSMPTAIAIRQVPGKPGQVWYPLDKMEVPKKQPGPNEVSHRPPSPIVSYSMLLLLAPVGLPASFLTAPRSQ